MPETAMVVPDRADIMRIGFEQELWRGIDSSRCLSTKRTLRRFASLINGPFDVKRLLARITLVIVPSHECPFLNPSIPSTILPDSRPLPLSPGRHHS